MIFAYCKLASNSELKWKIFQNASIYNIIRALWNNKVEQELPEIDQYAILEYYNEKLAEETAQQSIIVWLWNLIRGLFA